MLIKLLSDLHLIGNIPFTYEHHGEEVCVLAGDISEGLGGVIWAERTIPSTVRVLYVPGNHEYYGQDVDNLNKKFKAWNRMHNHVTVLLNDTFTTDQWEVEFVGTTLWTDFNLFGNAPLHSEVWRTGLNDSVYIRNKGARITANDFTRWNKSSIRFLRKVANEPTNKTRVLITHYCPELSIAARYRNDPLTAGFATKIPANIHEKFKYHLHGHTHDTMDYQCPYGTIVKCNPRGYGNENARGFNQSLVLDI